MKNNSFSTDVTSPMPTQRLGSTPISSKISPPKKRIRKTRAQRRTELRNDEPAYLDGAYYD